MSESQSWLEYRALILQALERHENELKALNASLNEAVKNLSGEVSELRAWKWKMAGFGSALVMIAPIVAEVLKAKLGLP